MSFFGRGHNVKKLFRGISGKELQNWIKKLDPKNLV
jgi:hypothetical protein